MSDTPSGTEARSSAGPQGSLAKLGNWLKSLQGVVVTFVAICTGLGGLIAGGCNVPLFVPACRTAGLVGGEPDASGTFRPRDAEAAAARKKEIERQIAAAGIQRDPQLESVNLVVWHQAPSDDPMVLLTAAALAAKGFTVREVVTNLANVAVDDKSPGKIWIKSVAARKDLRETVRDTILRAAPTEPSKNVVVYDPYLPSDDAEKIKRAGEIQVDMF